MHADNVEKLIIVRRVKPDPSTLGLSPDFSCLQIATNLSRPYQMENSPPLCVISAARGLCIAFFRSTRNRYALLPLGNGLVSCTLVRVTD